MPRHKRVTVLTRADRPMTADEVRHGICQLLAYTNQHQPIGEDSPPAARVFDELLTAISRRGAPARLRLAIAPGAPVDAQGIAATLMNIATVVGRSGYYLRRCRRCAWWMLTKDKRQWTCDGTDCRKEWSRERTAEARQRERKKRVNPVTVKGTDGTF